MKTLLFAPETFNLAETTRMIEVAKECRMHANCIFMGYSQKFAAFIKKEDFEFHYLHPYLKEQDITNILAFDQMKTVKVPFTYDMLKKRIDSELKLIEALEPDGVVIGSTVSLLISARVKEIPLVYVKPYAYSRAYIESPLFMKDSNGLLKRIVKTSILHLRWLPKVIRKLIKEYKVENKFEYTIDAMSADLNCITTPEILTNNPDPGRKSVYVGPIFANLKEEIPAELNQVILKSTKPLIYCSMGSSANRTIIFELLRNFAGIPVEVITPMKSYLSEKEQKQLPENVHVYDWLPAKEIQEQVTACILHGGEGTIQTACLAGKPFIGIGLQKEQEYNIRCCADYGAAIQIKKSQLKDSARFKKAVEELLTEPSYEKQAKKLQQVLLPNKGSTLAAKEILSFVTRCKRNRQPLD